MKKFRKILVTGGVHGDEPSGVNVANYFLKNSDLIKALLCNPKAVKANKRFVETDLNRSFGQTDPISYEERRAKKIGDIVKNYDLIIDIHNTKALGTTCAITVREPDEIHLNLVRHFGFKKLVIMPPSGSLISQSSKTAISLEIAKNSVKNFPDNILIKKIKMLNGGKTEAKNYKIELYKFVNKVQRATFNRLKMKKRDFLNFRKLSGEQKKKFGLGSGSYYPIFLKKKEDEDVTFTLVKRIDVK